VEESLFGLLQQARQVATTGDARMFGLEIGVVTNVKDPDKLGRVKVCLPRLPGKPESDWVRVVQPAAGPGRGFYWLPHVNDEVILAFERGEAHRPFVIGSVWNGKDAPMQGAYADENSTHMIQTKSGHQIVLDDANGAERIVIADKSGKRTLTFDVKNEKLSIEGAEGDVEVKAAKKIVLCCEDLEIKTQKKGKVDVGSTLEVKVAQKAQIEAGPRLDMKASRIDLNPGSANVAAVAAAVAARVAAAAAAAAAAAGPAAQSRQARGSGAGAGGGGATPAVVRGPGGGNVASDVVGPGRGQAGGAVGGKPQESPAKGGEGPASAATEQPQLAPSELAVQLFNAAGAPQKDMEVELTIGAEKHAGKTDANGVFKLSGLSQQGTARLEVPDIQVGEPGAATVQGRVRYAAGGIDVPIGRQTAVELPSRVRRCRLSGLNFETNKTFLLPQAMTGIRQLVKLYTSFEGIQGLVDGHTDKQPPKTGDTFEFNRKLSIERAEAIAAYLTDDAEAWQKFYGGTGASGQWGIREDQMILATAKDADGAPFYDGEIDGKTGPQTKAAYRSFQRSRLIDERDTANPETRRELVRAYMKLDGTSLPAGAKLEVHGCGLTHPLPETENDPERNQPKNRRVEVFLFDGEVDPKPVSPEPRQGCEEHAKWVGRMILDVDLDQPPGTLKVKVVDEKDEPVGTAHIHAAGPLPLDDDGPEVSFEDLIPGTYKVIASAEGLLAADREVVVPAGGAAEAKLTLQTEFFDLDVVVEDKLVPSEKLEGAHVEIDAPGIAAKKTDTDGLAKFEKLPKGSFKITARHERFHDGSITVQVPHRPKQKQERPAQARDAGPGDKPPVVSLERKAGPPFIQFKSKTGGLLAGKIQGFERGTALGGPIDFEDGKISLAKIDPKATRIVLTADADSIKEFNNKKRGGILPDEAHYIVTRPDKSLVIAGQLDQRKLELRQRPASDKEDWVVQVRDPIQDNFDGEGFQKVKHFFVLMLENRSFDHLLGHNPNLTEADTIANFDKRGEKPPSNTFDGGKVATATPGAPDSIVVDPGHEFDHAHHHLFRNGPGDPNNFPAGPVPMDGFAEQYFKRLSGQDPIVGKGGNQTIADTLNSRGTNAADWTPQIMKGFDRDRLRVINTLAEEFAVCDRWFSPMPGPTSPTRFFVHAGSSAGMDDSPSGSESVDFTAGFGLGFDGGTVFGKFKALEKKGLVARSYVTGGSQVGLLKGVNTPFRGLKFEPLGGLPAVLAARFNPDVSVKSLSDGLATRFDADEIKNKEGSYTFIEPNYGSPGKVVTSDPTQNFIDGNSQHPPANIQAGETLIRKIFEAIFMSDAKGPSPIRDQSVLIITYDEHGGFYDHVPPPAAIEVTDSRAAKFNKNKYKFGHYGVRLPAVIVSPLIPKGVVDHTIYDSTSILKTLQKRFATFGMTSLTNRDRFANDFAHLFTLTKPRDLSTPREAAVAQAVADAGPAELSPEQLAMPVSAFGLSFLAASAITVSELAPDRVADVRKRLEEVRTVQDALDFDADMTAAPVEVVVRVTDAASNPVPGVKVKLAFATVHEAQTSDGTDGQEKGTVRFKDVIPAKYTATTEHPGAEAPIAGPVVVAANTASLDLKVGTSAATFMLADATTGEPLPNATAIVLVGSEHRELQADARGVVLVPLKAGEQARLVEVVGLHTSSFEKA